LPGIIGLVPPPALDKIYEIIELLLRRIMACFIFSVNHDTIFEKEAEAGK
jgi:hypothetical protein